MLIKSMKAFIIFIFIFAFFVSCERKHESLPSNDRRVLEDFFELLIKDNDFAYSLFGTKPISIAGYFDNDPTSFRTFILEKGWISWQKYKDLFPSKNFELIQVDLGKQNGIHYKDIVLINKQATLNIIRKNLKIFQDFIKNDWQPEPILKTLIENNELFKNLEHRSDLFGILLGYGNTNALNFEKRTALSLHISKIISPPFQEDLEGLSKLGELFVKGYGKAELKPNTSLSLDLPSSKEELNKVVESMKPSDLDKSDFLLDHIQTVIFSCDLNDDETKLIRQNYSETRNKIIEAYDDKSIFEVTMNQWIKN